MNYYYEHLLPILHKYTTTPLERITEQSLIRKDLEIDGDDGVDLILEIARTFDVDIAEFPFKRYFFEESDVTPAAFLVRFFTRDEHEDLTVGQLLRAIENKRLQ